MTHYDQLTDEELLDLTRSGDRAAYGELYARHEAAGRRFARRLAGPGADDVVAEAFTKVLGAILRGRGPVDTFRPYLFTAIRSVAQRTGAKLGRTIPMADLETEGEPDGLLDEVLDAVDGPDRSVVLQAFGRLTKAQQEVLWYIDAEQRAPSELAEHFGSSPNAISARAYRARQALRRAFLELHFDVPSIDDRADCEAVRARLADHLRDELSEVERDEIEEHLEGCPRCRGLLSQVAVLSKHHGAVLPLPVVVGMAFAAEGTGAPPGGAAPAAAHGWGTRVRTAARTEPARVAATVLAVAAIASGLVVALRSEDGPRRIDAAMATPVDERPTTERSGSAPRREVVVADPDAPGSAPPVAGEAPAPSADAERSPAADPSPTRPADDRPVPPSPDPPIAVPIPSSPPTPPAPTTTTTTTPARPAPVADLELDVVGPAIAGGSAFLIGRSTATRDATVQVAIAVDPAVELRTLEVAGGSCTPSTRSCLVDARAGQVVELAVEVLAGTAPFDVTLRWSGEGVDRSADGTAITTSVVPVAGGDGHDAVRVGGSGVATTSASLVECVASSPECARSVPLRLRDDDLDPTTASSARAELAVPAAPVRWARLYWSAELAPDGGTPAADPAVRGRARLRTPSGADAEVVADQVRDLATSYLASADVTHLVRGSGTYLVADVQLGAGVGAWGAWTLVVITAPTEVGDRASLPVVVSSPFAAVAPGTTRDVPLPALDVPSAAPMAIDVVGLGAAPDRLGELRWSEGDGAVLGGRSGVHGAATPRLDHERLLATSSTYGSATVEAHATGGLALGVVVAREVA